ncbi:MAG: TatD family hydrolase [Actinomycetota bacterium]
MTEPSGQTVSDTVCPVIDSHCHVHDESIPGGADGAVELARAAGVAAMVTVGCDRGTTLAAIAVAERHDDVFATVGLHPHDAVNGTDTVADLLTDAEGAIPDTVVAVGEAGLDYYYDHSPRDVQRHVFAEQIALAHQHRLPLVIHSRDAWDDTFDILDAEGVPDRTIFHCFTGGPTEARGGLDRGIFLSFSGIVTFRSASDIQQAALDCPTERLLIETDSPYLAPVPHRGKPNRPAWVTDVARFVADLRDEALDEFSAASVEATRDAFAGRLGRTV